MGKKYLDLTGLTTFKNNIQTKLTGGTTDWVVAKAKGDEDGNVIKSTYVPGTRTIAGKALSANVTKEEMLTALGVADGAQVNVIEGVQVNGVDLTPASKKVNITVTTGDSTAGNGTIKVNGTAVSVYGLKGAAYVDVANNVTTTTAGGSVLDAYQGKLLADRVSALETIGRFLSTWNCNNAAGTLTAPTLGSFPSTASPYTYKSGDYYIIGTVASTGTNFKPKGSKLIWSGSTGSEVIDTSCYEADTSTDAPAANDKYFYDGTNWVLQKAGTGSVTWGTITGTLSAQTDLKAALDDKLDKTAKVNGQSFTVTGSNPPEATLNGTHVKLSSGYVKATGTEAIAAADPLETAIAKLDRDMPYDLSDLTFNNTITNSATTTGTAKSIEMVISPTTGDKIYALLHAGQTGVLTRDSSGVKSAIVLTDGEHGGPFQEENGKAAIAYMQSGSSDLGYVYPELIEQTSNRVTTIASTSTDAQYPTAKAVYTALPKDVSDLPFTHALTAVKRDDEQLYLDLVNNAQHTISDICPGQVLTAYEPSTTSMEGAYGIGLVSGITQTMFSAPDGKAAIAYIQKDETSPSVHYIYPEEIQLTTNLVTSISSASTDAKYPSAKCVYDQIALQVPQTRTIAGKALSADITKAEMLTALNVADGANKVEASTTNGNIKIDGTETTVYTHPTTTAVAAAFKKVGNDANGHVVLGDAIVKADITGIVGACTETTDDLGMFSAAEKTKLAGIAAGAEVNAIDTIKVNGTAQTITAKAVDLTIHNIPNAGTTGQLLAKVDGTDYNVAWVDAPAGSVTDVKVSADGTTWTSVVTSGVAQINLSTFADTPITEAEINALFA